MERYIAILKGSDGQYHHQFFSDHGRAKSYLSTYRLAQIHNYDIGMILGTYDLAENQATPFMADTSDIINANDIIRKRSETIIKYVELSKNLGRI